MKRTYGFTIVELLVVIVVIAILAAISIVAYNGISDRANDTRTTEAAAQIAKAIQMWAVDNPNLALGNSGSSTAIQDGLCTDGGGQGFVSS